MKRVCIVSMLLILSVNITAAQTPSAKETPGTPPPLPVLTPPDLPLTAKERQGVGFGKEWAGNRDKPARGTEGGIVFVFGSTLPTIVCAPLYVCDLALEVGETVNDLNVGDAVRWKVTPATQGTGETSIVHVLIKPTDVGLMTNLVITTSRRTYTIKLLARERDWMPRVSFEYPEDSNAQWKAYRVRADKQAELKAAEAATQVVPGHEETYSISGDTPPWRPKRVYSDGVKTYIEFPAEAAHGTLPVLVAFADDPSFLALDSLINGATPQLVNYRFVNDRFVVDRVLDRAELFSGVGPAKVSVKLNRNSRE